MLERGFKLIVTRVPMAAQQADTTKNTVRRGGIPPSTDLARLTSSV